MVLRRVLAEAISQATEASRPSSPIDLFDLEAMRPERVVETVVQRPRDVEIPADDIKRSERPQPVAVAALRQRHVGVVRRADVVAGLKSPDAVRRALVLREILGPPRSINGWDD